MNQILRNPCLGQNLRAARTMLHARCSHHSPHNTIPSDYCSFFSFFSFLYVAFIYCMHYAFVASACRVWRRQAPTTAQTLRPSALSRSGPRRVPCPSRGVAARASTLWILEGQKRASPRSERVADATCSEEGAPTAATGDSHKYMHHEHVHASLTRRLFAPIGVRTTLTKHRSSYATDKTKTNQNLVLALKPAVKPARAAMPVRPTIAP